MARVERNKVEYFPHDATAGSSDTLTILQSQFGNDGYAVWFKLLEKLAQSENHVIDCSNKLRWKLLVAYLGTDEITTVEIINLLVEMQSLDKDLWQSKLIWSENFIKRVSNVYKNRKRQIPSKPIITKVNTITTSSNEITTNSYTHSKVKYIYTPIVPKGFDIFWKEYPKKVAKGDAERVFKKINPSSDLLSKIMEAIKKQKQSIQWTKDGGQYIPNPSTWLNQKRWEDELEQQPVQNPVQEPVSVYGRYR